MINVAGSVGRWTLNQLAIGAQVSVLMVETMTWMIVAPLRGKGLPSGQPQAAITLDDLRKRREGTS